MDAKQALDDLTEISSQIRTAVLLDEKGAVAASTFESEERAAPVGKAATDLLAAAERTRPGLGPGALTQLEVATLEGSVFVVREHGRVLAATTSPEPTVGLVFYDLKSCLRHAEEGAKARDAGERRRGAAKTKAKPTEEGAKPKAAAKRPRKRPASDDASA